MDTNAVLPSFPGLAWPQGKTPIWSTDIKTSVSGREYPSSPWSYPRWRYKLAFEVLRSKPSLTEMQQMAAFFNAAKGMGNTWLYDDPEDRQATAMPFGIGDGATTQFQLTSSFGGYVEPVRGVNAVSRIEDSVCALGTSLLPVNIGQMAIDANSDGLADGWASYQTGSVGTASYTIGSGMYLGGYQSVSASALNGTIGVRTLNTVPVTAGNQYSVHSYVSAPTGRSVTVYVGWRNAANTVEVSNSQATVTGTGSAQLLTATGTCPAGATQCYIYFWVSSAAGTACSLGVDEVNFCAGDPQPYGSQRADYHWTVDSFGLVTFAPYHPDVGMNLFWTGTYYKRVRFMRDDLEFNEFMKYFWDLRALEFITVKA